LPLTAAFQAGETDDLAAPKGEGQTLELVIANILQLYENFAAPAPAPGDGFDRMGMSSAEQPKQLRLADPFRPP